MPILSQPVQGKVKAINKIYMIEVVENEKIMYYFFGENTGKFYGKIEKNEQE